MRYRYTVITAVKPGILSKSFKLEGDNLIKSPGGAFIEGSARKREETLHEFARTLMALGSHQALCYGLPRIEGDFAKVVLRELKGAIQSDSPVIAHIKEDFQYEAAPGLLLGDVDFTPYNKTLTVEEIQERLYGVVPALRDQIPHVISHSASSWIYNAKTGELVKGEAGKHFYIAVEDAREIPAIGERLFELLWLRGCGYNYLKSNGVWEPRALLDRKVWYQSCYDFAGGAWCDDPLEQRRPDPILINPGGEPLSLDMLPKANKKRVTLLIESDQEDREPERAAKEAEWLSKREQEQEDEYNKRGEQFTDEKRCQFREHLKRICEDQVLSHDDVVHSKPKGKVSVKEVLGHTDEFHETLFRDPADPEYNHGEFVAKAYLKGRFPFIHSFRSGTPTRYYLGIKPDENRPETPAEMDLRHALADRVELAKHRDKLWEELERPKAQGSEKETRKSEKALHDCDSKFTKLDRKVEKLQAKTRKRSPFTDDNGNSLYASQIADYLAREQIRDLLYDPATETWYRYKEGYHQVVTKHALQVYVRDLISETDPAFGFTPKMAGDITDCVSTLTVWPDGAKELEKAIPFQNGVLRTDTLEFIAHRKEYWFRHVLPFDYAEGVELATEIREFFELIVDEPEHVELLQAIFRAIICGDLVAYQIFIVFIGDPGSGKSTIFDLLVEVVGERFTCATDLRRLEESPFEAAKFFGKKLAVIDDCHKYPGAIQRVKSIVTGGLISLEKKGKDPVDFRNEASLVLASNFPIKADGGTERRILYFPLPRKIKFDKTPTEVRLFPDDPVIIERVKRWKREGYISSVITWALSMPEVRQKELLTHTEVAMPSIVAHQVEYMLDTNEVLAWLRYYVMVTEPTDRVEVGSCELENGHIKNCAYQAYPSYCKMCQEHGRKPKGRNAFANELRSLVETRMPVKGVRYAPITRGDRQGVKALWGVKIVEFGMTDGKSLVEIFFGLGANAEMPINALCNIDNVVEMGRPQLPHKEKPKQRVGENARGKR